MLIAIFTLARISQAAESSPTAKHFLWRVTNAPAPFYLLGSLHALRGSDYPLPQAIEYAIGRSRKVIFETNPNAKDAPLLQKKLLAAGDYPQGITIEKKVEPKTFALLRQIADTRLSTYESRRPWAIAFFMLSEPGAASFRRRLSVDGHIYNKVRGRKEIDGLETVDEFVHTLGGMSDRESEAFLLDCIGFARRAPQLFLETTAAWKSGDTQRMYRLYRRGQNSGYWSWIEQRHPKWIPRIENAVRSGRPTLVVAGALHFCGPDSILAILRARGYKVEQL